MTDPVLDVLRDPGFAHGLRAATPVVAVGLLLAVAWRAAGRRSPLPIAGLLLAAAAVMGLDRAGQGSGLATGLAALAAGGLVADVLPVPRLMVGALSLPGAWLVASETGLVDVRWIRTTVVATIVVGSALVADFDARWRQRAPGPLLVAVSAGGIYATVPDTEQAIVVLGAALAVAVVAWPWPQASLGSGGACAATGLLAWTVAAGGFGRSTSVVGGVAALGLLVAEPLGRRLPGARRRPGRDPAGSRWWSVAVLGVAQVALVTFVTRVAGLSTTLTGAVALAAAALGAAALAAAVYGRRTAGAGRPAAVSGRSGPSAGPATSRPGPGRR